MTIVVPSELATRRQWINWRFVNDRKIPIDAKTNRPAKSNDPSTWTTLGIAKMRGGLLGFVFAENGGIVGIDLDGCLVNGELAAWANEVILSLNTYAEISPSGTGIKLFCRGKLNSKTGKKRFIDQPGIAGEGKRPAIEAYDWGRYFCYTGDHWPETPLSVSDCQVALDALVARYWPPEVKTGQPARVPQTDVGNVATRAARYLERLPVAISGQGGHDATYRAANVLVNGFALSVSESLGLLEVWNARCDPPWSERELLHKLNSAANGGAERGYLLTVEVQPKKDRFIMAASFNQVQLLGNLTRDVEVKYLQSGTAVADLSLAINEKRKQGSEWIEDVSFIDVTCFGRTAEIAGEYLSKGSPVLIAGKLKQERWERDNAKHSKVKVICESLTLLGGGKRDIEREPEPRRESQQQQTNYDDIPF